MKVQKEADFPGKQSLLEQIEKGPERKLAGIEMLDRGIPRTGYKIFANGEQVGFITSGTRSPTLKKNIGLALIKSEFATEWTELFVEIRNKRLKPEVVPVPFYKKLKT